jgi:hypothetical protein
MLEEFGFFRAGALDLKQAKPVAKQPAIIIGTMQRVLKVKMQALKKPILQLGGV